MAGEIGTGGLGLGPRWCSALSQVTTPTLQLTRVVFSSLASHRHHHQSSFVVVVGIYDSFQKQDLARRARQVSARRHGASGARPPGPPTHSSSNALLGWGALVQIRSVQRTTRCGYGPPPIFLAMRIDHARRLAGASCVSCVVSTAGRGAAANRALGLAGNAGVRWWGAPRD